LRIGALKRLDGADTLGALEVASEVVQTGVSVTRETKDRASVAQRKIVGRVMSFSDRRSLPPLSPPSMPRTS
jgi:hypothetical protein